MAIAGRLKLPHSRHRNCHRSTNELQKLIEHSGLLGRIGLTEELACHLPEWRRLIGMEHRREAPT